MNNFELKYIMYLEHEPSWGPIQNKNDKYCIEKFLSTGYKLIL